MKEVFPFRAKFFVWNFKSVGNVTLKNFELVFFRFHKYELRVDEKENLLDFTKIKLEEFFDPI